MDNGQFSVHPVTNTHISSTLRYGHWLYLRTVYVHVTIIYALVVDIVPCSNYDIFLCRLIRFYT